MAWCRRFACFAALIAALPGVVSAADLGVDSSDSIFDWTIGDPDWKSPAEEHDRIHTDRPHISEATSTVGLGHLQIETGYTYFEDESDGVRSRAHSFPEPLLRWGVLAEWFELRLGWNYLVTTDEGPGGVDFRQSGSEDMLLAAKVALVKQRGILPDITIFPQFRLPTGADVFNADRVLPGVNIAYSWILTETIEIECNSIFNNKRDDLNHTYLEYLQTLNIEYELGEQWIAFTEYLAFMPSSSLTAQFEQYFHTGLQYFITPNMQVDIHAAVGLNEAAADLAFTGVGFSVRF